jgi:chorismate-pyruvate lyase
VIERERAPGRSRSPVTAAGPADLQRVLFDSAVTVTQFLETLTGEELVADVIDQHPTAAGAGNHLGVSAALIVTQRSAVLTGRTTALPYVYAESMYVPERLSPRSLRRLECTTDPIGRVLAASGLRPSREPVAGPIGVATATPIVAPRLGEVVWSRAYQLLIDDVPVFSISEWFFRSVLDALDRRNAA